MNQVSPPASTQKGVVLFKVRSATPPGVPSGIGALAPNDIATVTSRSTRPVWLLQRR